LFLQYAAKRFMRDRCFEAAGSLTFTTLLALVPIMFIGIAALSAFPVFEQIQINLQDMLTRNVAPEVEATALEFLNRFTANPGRMSTVGITGLVITAIILLINIESAFNAIWRVTERRSFIWRMVSFWAVLTMGPVLLGISLSVSGGLLAPESTGTSGPLEPLGVAGRVLPPILECVGFLIIYTILPNRPVQFRHALVGAVAAAVMLEILRTLMFAYASHFTAIKTVYGLAAAFPVFLLVLYVGWVVALAGAVTAASLAEWGARSDVLGRPHLSPGNRLAVSLAVLEELYKASRLGMMRRRKDLLRNLSLGAFVVETVLDDLARAKYIARVGRDQWVVTRDLEQSTVYDLYSDLKLNVGGDVFRWMRPASWQSKAGEMIMAFDTFGHQCMGASLKELFTTGAGASPPTARDSNSDRDDNV
jgi:membrane protein